MSWPDAAFWEPFGDFCLKVGIPGILSIGVIVCGYWFFRRPPWCTCRRKR